MHVDFKCCNFSTGEGEAPIPEDMVNKSSLFSKDFLLTVKVINKRLNMLPTNNVKPYEICVGAFFLLILK